MNIHPIFVHFPVALFTLYALFEIIRLPFIRKAVWYFYVKAVLVIAGALAACAALFTGEMAEDMLRGSSLQPVIEVHSTFAYTTTFFFIAVALIYIVGWLRRANKMPLGQNSKLWNGLVTLETYITERWLGVIVGLIGLGLISLVGALGGIIAYGPTNDPVSNLIYTLFFK